MKIEACSHCHQYIQGENPATYQNPKGTYRVHSKCLNAFMRVRNPPVDRKKERRSAIERGNSWEQKYSARVNDLCTKVITIAVLCAGLAAILLHDLNNSANSV